LTFLRRSNGRTLRPSPHPLPSVHDVILDVINGNRIALPTLRAPSVAVAEHREAPFTPMIGTPAAEVAMAPLLVENGYSLLEMNGAGLVVPGPIPIVM
jgi:hypothetical protein